MLLVDLIIDIANNIVKIQNKDGSLPEGHNGPYFDQETPVRNTAHWLITFSRCYHLTDDIKFKNKVYETAEYIYSKKVRPFN